MPDIQAFRGIRYDLGHVGNLSDVVAPPYDVIDSDLQDALYKKHPANVIRLILNREEPGDDENSNRYSRAARFLKSWQQQGVMFREADPAVYVYHLSFQVNGREHTRRGFLCGVRLERFGEGKIYPHEETYPGPKADRLQLMRSTRVNPSPIFGLYPDTQHAAQGLLDEAIAGQTPIQADDHLGVVHRLWPVVDVATIAALNGVMGPKPLFIADGHHRYETACTYRDETSSSKPDHPSCWVLMACVGMSDPGMLVLPTHRLFKGIPPVTSDVLLQKLGPYFESRIAGEGADLAVHVWQEIEGGQDQAQLGLYTHEDERWIVTRLTEDGRRKLAEVASDHSPAWQGLGVSILHRFIVQTLLSQTDPPKPDYVHLVDDVIARLERHNSDEEPYALTALVMPATVEDIRALSELGERMPQKSTYFYPKLLSGLVVNPVE